METFWGEMHTHTFCGGGEWGSTADAAQIAREHLDFWAPGEHLGHPKFDWPRICCAVAEANEPGRLVTFPGFEAGGVPGDFNAYFPYDNPPAYDVSKKEDVLGLCGYAAENGAIVIPHHTGYKVGCRGMQWDRFWRPDVMPLVEIFSMHGSSERDPGPWPLDLAWMGPRESGGCALTGLRRGHRFGFIASSDGHNGYPGTYGMGLLGLKAPELTREAVFAALRNRRTWAVTGDRIDVREFRAGAATLGGAVRPGPVDIAFDIEALDSIDAVDVLHNGRVVKRFTALHESDEGGPYVLRFGWGWSGRNMEIEWSGTLDVSAGRILRAVPVFGPPAPDTYSVDGASVSFSSVTSGYCGDWTTNRYRCGNDCAIVLVVDGDPATKLHVSVNGMEIERTVEQMLSESEISFIPDDRANAPWARPKVKVYRAIPAARFRMRERMQAAMEDGDFLYLRIRQENSQMAWLSPVFARPD